MRKMNAQRFAKMVDVLMRECVTIIHLAKTVNVSEPVVREYVNALHHVRPRILRIGDWENCRTDEIPLWVPAFTFGKEPDARRPAKLDPNERCRRYRQRKKMKALQAVLAGAGK